MRRLIVVALVASLASCGGGSGSGGDPLHSTPVVTPLANDQLVFDSTRHDPANPNANREIYVMRNDGNGNTIKRLTNDAAYQNWWPRISPDRKKILFYRRPASIQDDLYEYASLWVMNADGTGVTQLIGQGAQNPYGWLVQGHAEWSPDGNKIAMFGTYTANGTVQIFVTDSAGRSPVRYTNQPGINTDVSWSLDGTKLLFNGCPSLPLPSPCATATNKEIFYEIFVMDASLPLSTPTQLTSDGLADYDPYFSPDGSTIAWLTHTNPSTAVNFGFGTWGIKLMDADGSNKRILIDDGQVNSKPAWSLDGNTIYFHRMDFTDEPFVFGVFSIGKTGMGLSRLTAVGTGVNEFPSNY